MKGTYLGELEELILLVVANLREEAYGLQIRNYIREHCQRSVSISTVHSTIHRLEEKGFLRSMYDTSHSSERGGRPKLIFSLTSTGKVTIKAARELRNGLWDTMPTLSIVKTL